MKISLIHPSRGRAKQARAALDLWLDRASKEIVIEHILSIDESDDDYEKQLYHELFFFGTKLVVNDNKSLVEATNIAAQKATGDILFYFSDDFHCPVNWDQEILSRLSISDVWMLRVDDGYQPFENLVLTIPIMSSALYNRLGYFFYEEYKSQWCDCDLYAVTEPYIINAPDLTFIHKRLPADKTYQENEANFEQGREIFKRRAAEHGWKSPFNKMIS